MSLFACSILNSCYLELAHNSLFGLVENLNEKNLLN